MAHEVEYAAAETKGCSSRLTIGGKIFFARLPESSNQSTRYFAGDQKGIITKEISRIEFDFWLNTLAENGEEIDLIRRELSEGRKYP